MASVRAASDANSALGRSVGPAVDQREHRRHVTAVGQGQEHPAALLAPLENAGIGEDVDVARNARLALAEHLRKLADRQFHDPQQGQNAQPRRVGERLESIGERKGDSQ